MERSVVFAILLMGLQTEAINTLAEGFRLNANSKVSIQGHGTCRTFTNSSATKAFFIPTATASEYSSFISGIPAEVTYATCKSCAEIKTNSGDAPGSTIYQIDPDGAAGIAAFSVYCDMVTDGGGWTVFYANPGTDGSVPLVSNSENTTGNPLSFQAYNLSLAKKVAISQVSTQSLLYRNNATWIKWSSAYFDANINTASRHADYYVTITANNGTSAMGYAGWSNFYNSGGGDYGVTTAVGFDHHHSYYYHLRSGCTYHYFYSYSAGVLDGDASYQVNTSLGTWAATASCSSNEGAGLIFYSAMK